MATLRNQIVARVHALLIGTTGAGDNCYRSRAIPVERDLSPAIVIRPGYEQTRANSEGSDVSDFDVIIELLTRGDPADAVADPIALDLHRILRADFRDGQYNGTAGTLGALCSDVRRTQADWAVDDADESSGLLTLRYTCTYLSDVDAIDRPPSF